MEAFTNIYQEWCEMKNEMDVLKKKEIALSAKVTAMSTSHEEELNKMKNDCEELRRENRMTKDLAAQLVTKIISTESDLVETNKLVTAMSTSHEEELNKMKNGCEELRRENRMTKDLAARLAAKIISTESDLAEMNKLVISSMYTLKEHSGNVNKLKSIWNRAIVLSHNKKDHNSESPSSTVEQAQALSPPANVNAYGLNQPNTVKVNAEAMFPSTKLKSILKFPSKTANAQGCSSSTAATLSATVPDYSASPQRGTLGLKSRTEFHVKTAHRQFKRMLNGQRIDSYETVLIRNDYINDRTGIYKIPIRGRYKFCVDRRILTGKGDVPLFLCGSNGRREKVVFRDFGWRYQTCWDCVKDLEVWLEAGLGPESMGAKYNIGFYGWLDLEVDS